MPKLSVIEASGNESERGSRARTERDAARRALTERHALAATERETALAKRVEELTAERDEHLQFRQSEVEKWGAEVFKAEKNLEAALYENGLLERRVSDRDREIAIVNARLDELRRVLSELVRK